ITGVTTDANALINKIVGPGITVSPGATLTGGPLSAGFWSDGVNEGILLTTGDVYFAEPPNNDDGFLSSGYASLSGDTDLDAIIPNGPTTDCTSLEFEFESAGGDLFFEFVFASEEYNEFVDGIFNDAFAFFLDGQNIALIPGTNTPVSIDTVNLGVNAGYYNNNDDGTYGSLIGYDGFTDVLTAEALGLVPGKHTIKMVISDVFDEIYDSGVFIKAGTFSDERPETEVQNWSVTPIGGDWNDSNDPRDQGQTIIDANMITNSLEWGIRFDASARDTAANLPHPGSVAPLREINTQRLLPGIMIENNVLAFGGTGGILFSGDDNSLGSIGAVPFGRIVNNTIYGASDATVGGTGIQVGINASPTVLNNIVAGTNVGIQVDPSSNSTVIGATVYQDNNTDTVGTGLGTFPIQLAPNDPLFVDAARANFYLMAGSRAIDSSLNSLADRPALTTVRDPLGIPNSPILAPEYDLFGQLRADDPAVNPPAGSGQNIFKDRGALDRIDIAGPTVRVTDPLDNDNAGNDRNPEEGEVLIVGETVYVFELQLFDVNGIGIDDDSVTSDTLQLYRDGVLLQLGRDYSFAYNSTNDVIRLVPASGIWINGSTYTIVLDNSAGGIRDEANNPLAPNQPGGETIFTIALSGVDYGDAPDPSYPSLAENDGARHVVISDYHLGNRVSHEIDSHQNTVATGDPFDDGVRFDLAVLMGSTVDVTIDVSLPANPPAELRNGGFIDAWIDYNNDGVWDDPADPSDDFEHVLASYHVDEGVNIVPLAIPAVSAEVQPGKVFTRFRFSSDGGLSPTGEAANGEVEDYQIHMVEFLEDFGDAPDPDYPTLLSNNGPRHTIVPGFHLGSSVDYELDGQPDADATGDDFTRVSDEDGVISAAGLFQGLSSEVTVIASAAGMLDAWVDFNADGDWDDPGEQIFASQALVAGDNPLLFAVPEDAVLGETFGRFRFSDTGGLSYDGPAADQYAPVGEVEDHKLVIVDPPYDFGDAPDPPHATLLENNGARHRQDPGTPLFLGAGVDTELDGLPTVLADGDDLDGTDDDDGVVFNTPLAIGEFASVTVTSSMDGGLLNAWIDFNNDGDWADTGEHVFFNTYLVAGENTLPFSVPSNAVKATKPYARFRVSTQANLSFDGVAPNGEVEDYQVQLVGVPEDFGDAPDPTYPTLAANDGARHQIDWDFHLGPAIDHEPDALPNPTATGDDMDYSSDEDGIVFDTPNLIPGHTIGLTANVVNNSLNSNDGYLNAWIDFNGDGDWADTGEQIFTDQLLATGDNALSFVVPEEIDGVPLMGVTTFARFRFSHISGLSYDGPAADVENAPDGEVEDYRVEIVVGGGSISGYKFDDRNANGIWDADM
ncbi:MAG TPA: choice-of-anchor L domain-containing protein, partial [Thermoguttaceae bacterium]|nr:choice-of-anchor L domain-containing protein [Thermoguttaceae bacterium]